MLTGFAPSPIYTRQGHQKDPSPSSAISRLISAAVVNKRFRDLLLRDPNQALEQGYQGEIFPLDYHERHLVLSIQADNLRDFALQLNSHQEDKLQGWKAEWIPADQKALVLEPK
jgi:hypothetical protein